MNLPQTGGCQCGKVRYEITEIPQLVYTCHCRDCQRITSSAFSLGITLPKRPSVALQARCERSSAWPTADGSIPGLCAQIARVGYIAYRAAA